MSIKTSNDRLLTGRHPGMTRVLFGDAYIAIRLLREALRRMAGVPAGASFLTQMFAIGVLATAIHRAAAPLLKVLHRPKPSVAGTAIGIAVLREIPRGVAGVQAGETSFAGTALAVSLVGPTIHRVAAPMRIVAAALAALGRWLAAD